MKITLTHQLPPSAGNPRNSEGAFIRGKGGEILFAYSHYHGNDISDHASCDIALISSSDEGLTWSEPEIIVKASDLGVKNVMSVSAVEQQNGDIGFYFLVKENDLSSSIGRAVSSDGKNFRVERPEKKYPTKYYVINNDRVIRLRDGRLVAPASHIPVECNTPELHRMPATMTCLLSDDDGASFYKADIDYTTKDRVNMRYGFQEPGAIEREDGIYMWARTNYGCQYEALFTESFETLEAPHASEFTSPPSPMQIKWIGGAAYAVYNPIPRYNGRVSAEGTRDRTPFVIRKSSDAVTFGKLNTIEDDPTRGYCYPALFGTNDGHILIAYCRGDAKDGNTLCRLGIARIEISTVE